MRAHQLRTAFFLILVITVVGTGGLDATTFVGANDVPGLIAAIRAANSSPGADTIDLARGSEYILTAVDTTVDNSNKCIGDNGLPPITTKIVINGNNSAIIRDSSPTTPNFRIFCVAKDNDLPTNVVGDLTLNDLRVLGGKASGSSSGGGIAVEPIAPDHAALTLNRSAVCDNTAFSGGGIYLGSQNNLITPVDSGTLTMIDSLICRNHATKDNGAGGGLYNRRGGTMFLFNSTVRDNVTDGIGGGGLWNALEGYVVITGSTFSGNKALKASHGFGGAIQSNQSSVILRNSTISGNSAREGGGIYNQGNIGKMNLTHCSVINNSAGIAGGIYNVDDVLTPTIHSPSTVTLKNTIVGESKLLNAASGIDTEGIVIVAGDNFVQTPGGTFTGDLRALSSVTSRFGFPLNVFPLNNYGGSTSTHDLRASSPARNAVTAPGLGPGYCPPTDQRGVARPQPRSRRGKCDIGAVERTEPLRSRIEEPLQ